MGRILSLVSGSLPIAALAAALPLARRRGRDRPPCAQTTPLP